MIANRSSRKLLLLIAVYFLSFASISNGTEEMVIVGNFSGTEATSELPPGWKPLTFSSIKRHTHYTLVKDGNTVVLKAESNASASGLIRKIRIDPKEYKLITWRWKITNVLAKGDAMKKEGDDFPARVYINFEYDPQKLGLLEKVKYNTARLIYGEYPPLCAITYIWGNKIPEGSIVPNSHTDKAVMIVVETGKHRLNQWIDVTRNIYEDYRAVFQEDPPMITSVAVITDTDNTGDSALTYYGDIILRKP